MAVELLHISGSAVRLFVAEGTALNDPTTWINWGVLGLVLVLLLKGWIWSKPSVDKIVEEKDRAIAERDRAVAQRDEMAQVMNEKVLPFAQIFLTTAQEFLTTVRAAIPALEEIQRRANTLPLSDDLHESGDSRGRRQRRDT